MKGTARLLMAKAPTARTEKLTPSLPSSARRLAGVYGESVRRAQPPPSPGRRGETRQVSGCGQVTEDEQTFPPGTSPSGGSFGESLAAEVGERGDLPACHHLPAG